MVAPVLLLPALCVSQSASGLRETTGRLSQALGEWLASWRGRTGCDRRACVRVAANEPMDLVPLSDESAEPMGMPERVICCDISDHGLRIRHRGPLVFRTVGLSFPGNELQFVTRLKWCRFTRDGQYESGGMFVKVIERKLT